MKLEEIEIKKIKPYDKNSRKHSSDQIEKIANSIKDFGFNQPLVLDENYEILVGHGRFLAAELLGLSKISCVVLTQLNESKKRAYRILDNKLQNDSEWNFENLTSELMFLVEADFSIQDWGLDSFIIDENALTIKNKQLDQDSDSSSARIKEFLILITCENEVQQKEFYDRFQDEGLTCKLIG